MLFYNLYHLIVPFEAITKFSRWECIQNSPFTIFDIILRALFHTWTMHQMNFRNNTNNLRTNINILIAIFPYRRVQSKLDKLVIMLRATFHISYKRCCSLYFVCLVSNEISSVQTIQMILSINDWKNINLFYKPKMCFCCFVFRAYSIWYTQFPVPSIAAIKLFAMLIRYRKMFDWKIHQMENRFSFHSNKCGTLKLKPRRQTK